MQTENHRHASSALEDTLLGVVVDGARFLGLPSTLMCPAGRSAASPDGR